MRKTIEDLWNGEINPVERGFRKGSEFHNLLKLSIRNQEQLLELLNDGEKELFEKYKDCQEEMSWIEHKEIFVSGFRLGARLMLESLTDDDDGCICGNDTDVQP